MEKKKKLTTSNGTIELERPVVMGILNLTPDSFYDGGRFPGETGWLDHAGKMLEEGAAIIDIGGLSTRPGAEEVSVEEELQRILPAVEKISKHHPEAILSVDTYRSSVAAACIRAGAHIINDISGGRFDEHMFPLIATLKVPYILMHMQGIPRDMQSAPQYDDVVLEVKQFFETQLKKLRALGIHENVVIDPGFGFGKSVEHNFELLGRIPEFHSLGCPMMAGVSRKSMINRVLGTRPGQSLNGTSVIHTIALLNGANILRVHDVKEAVETIKLVTYYKSNH